jgi:hypothetical protein
VGIPRRLRSFADGQPSPRDPGEHPVSQASAGTRPASGRATRLLECRTAGIHDRRHGVACHNPSTLLWPPPGRGDPHPPRYKPVAPPHTAPQRGRTLVAGLPGLWPSVWCGLPGPTCAEPAARDAMGLPTMRGTGLPEPARRQRRSGAPETEEGSDARRRSLEPVHAAASAAQGDASTNLRSALRRGNGRISCGLRQREDRPSAPDGRALGVRCRRSGS